MKIMKKFLCVFVMMCMVLMHAPESVHAAGSGSCGSNVKWSLSNKGVLTISGTGAMTNYDSAESVPWYKDRASIVSVTMSDGITSIGNYVFSGCSSAKDFKLSKDVKSIGFSAFDGCSSVKDISVPLKVTKIERWAFRNCTSLETVSIPECVSAFYDAFDGCTSLLYLFFLGSVEQWNRLGLYAPDYHYAILRVFGQEKVPELSVSPENTGMRLTWESVRGADGYQIFSATDGKHYTKIKSVKADCLVYTDNSVVIGTSYTYKVKAYRKGVSGDTIYAADTITSSVNYNPSVSTPVISNQRPGLKVSWEAIEGVTGYHVYRKAAGEKKFTRIRVISSKYNYITDPDVQSGISYTYKVRAYYKDADGVTHLGAFSEKKSLRRIGTPAMSLTASRNESPSGRHRHLPSGAQRRRELCL